MIDLGYKRSQLFERLNDAYGRTTMSNQAFKKLINRIKWDKTFNADGETYFIKYGLTLTVENVNPFEESWRPMCLFPEGYMRELGYHQYDDGIICP